MLIPLFIIYIKKKFKFLLIYNITVIISFGYPTYNIAKFFFLLIYV